MHNITGQIVTLGIGMNPVLPESPAAHKAGSPAFPPDGAPTNDPEAALIRKITGTIVIVGGALFLASRIF